MNLNDKFLTAYKQLEAELKCDEKTVLDYEATLQGVVAEQLKSCRIMRNYMAHNDLEFLSASSNQIKFINEQIANIRKTAQLVKNATKKIPLAKENEQLKNIAITVQKYGIAPIQTTKGIYLVNSDIIVSNYVNANKKIVIPTKIPKYQYISPTIRLSEVNNQNQLYIVTDDGTSKGQYIGLLMF